MQLEAKQSLITK